MENFFVTLAEKLEGYSDFQKESLAFKVRSSFTPSVQIVSRSTDPCNRQHCRIDVERRVENGNGWVKTSDIAHLLELFQSALLKYWEFEPQNPDPKAAKRAKDKKAGEDEKAARKKADQDRERKENATVEATNSKGKAKEERKEESEVEKATLRGSRTVKAEEAEKKEAATDGHGNADQPEEEEWKPPTKKIPVLCAAHPHGTNKIADAVSQLP